MNRYSRNDRFNAVYSRRRRSIDWFPIAFVAVIILVVGGVIFGIANATHVETQHNCVVTDKDRTRGNEGKSDMRVYTENCGVLRVADSLLSFTWSSSDTYNEIKVGETYDFTTRGRRIPFFSMFPNVVEVEQR